MSESVILCEGYLDRAFWAAWLEHLGCTIPERRGRVEDSLGRLVSKGHYMYQSKSGEFIRVVPCHGRSKVQPEALSRLKQRNLRPRLTHLVLNVDPNTDARVPSAATGLRHQDVHALVRALDLAAIANEHGDVVLDGGASRVSLVRWEAGDPVAPGVPGQQTLERLVCAALVATYPERGPVVHGWLKSRPDPPAANPKEAAWSYMAGWYADTGCEAFYRVLWSDQQIVEQLRARLEQSGAWRIAEALAE